MLNRPRVRANDNTKIRRDSQSLFEVNPSSFDPHCRAVQVEVRWATFVSIAKSSHSADAWFGSFALLAVCHVRLVVRVVRRSHIVGSFSSGKWSRLSANCSLGWESPSPFSDGYLMWSTSLVSDDWNCSKSNALRRLISGLTRFACPCPRRCSLLALEPYFDRCFRCTWCRWPSRCSFRPLNSTRTHTYTGGKSVKCKNLLHSYWWIKNGDSLHDPHRANLTLWKFVP